MSYPEKLGSKDVACPTCGGPATKVTYGYHPFGSGTNRVEHKAKLCACGGKEPLAVVEGWAMRMAGGWLQVMANSPEVYYMRNTGLDVDNNKDILSNNTLLVMPSEGFKNMSSKDINLSCFRQLKNMVDNIIEERYE